MHAIEPNGRIKVATIIVATSRVKVAEVSYTGASATGPYEQVDVDDKNGKTRSVQVARIAEGDVVYRGFKDLTCDDVTDDNVSGREGDPSCWFSTKDVATTYAVQKSDTKALDPQKVVPFRAVKDLVLFDLLNANNVRALLAFHESDADVCKAIRDATGFETEPVKNPTYTKRAFLSPESTLTSTGGIVIGENDSGNDVYEKYVDLYDSELVDAVQLVGHCVGHGDGCFNRYSQTAHDVAMLNAIEAMFPSLDGYCAAETYGHDQGIFLPEIALFGSEGRVAKVCAADVTMSAGGASHWGALAASIVVVVVATCMA